MEYLCCICGVGKVDKVKLDEHIRREHSDKQIVTEAVHSALRFHDEAHGYTINMKGSPMHMKQQHRSTVSFNSRNLGDV